MTMRVRPARAEDFPAIYKMAKLTGGGFTNLPPDKATLVEKLARSAASFEREDDEQSGDLYVFVLEDAKTKAIRGTCQVFGQVGVTQPFYSYHLSTLTQSSPELGKTFRNETLTLTTDLEGSSEVGGLFLHPESRAGGLGALLARSRYLFMKLHRQRFGDRTLAELRGVMDEAGNAPFWDALAGKFFGMTFPDADEFNAVHGTKFIADLMPRTPIYVALLPDSAKAVMGQPHPSGRAAMKMLEAEGFAFDRYIDIFDGGPTVTCPTDQIRTIRQSDVHSVAEIGEGGKQKVLIATGRLNSFRACCATIGKVPKKGLCIDRQTADLLEVEVGDKVVAVSRNGST
ncbi:arginine N-succinyltransferase [Sphingomonas sp. RG327]|jgi:arginine N-succinyltransferase|uniref:Arginine N-succinyltransferase n=1 Tax=Sphingomonas anseongensis TaxID=2908207 RepID=A0ABT0RES9_9SPHN|nr:arginine N-succinyltransferase [Sphingomonas anseongensis]MCL6678769.1 arginine N-succinyltransferase [Sphingomonas anseongensis]